MEFEVPAEYPSIVLAMITYGLLMVVTSFAVVIATRKRLFTKDFLKQFASEHKAAFPESKLPELGFPDIGSGRFSKKLSYKDWMTFNNAMRSHHNMVEQYPIILMTMLVGGLVIPVATYYVAWFSVVCRIAYVIGYVMWGPNSRVLGAIAGLIPIYGVLLYSMYALSKDALLRL